jgi:hypothetical protein
MSKLVDINQYLTLKNYAKKYGVCGRKLYRHRYDDEIDFINIDGKFFIRDERSIKLETNNSGRPPSKSVKNLTSNDKSVKKLTSKTEKPLRLAGNKDSKNVKKLTLSDSINVKNLTDNERLEQLLAIPEDKRSIKDFDEIDQLRKKL